MEWPFADPRDGSRNIIATIQVPIRRPNHTGRRRRAADSHRRGAACRAGARPGRLCTVRGRPAARPRRVADRPEAIRRSRPRMRPCGGWKGLDCAARRTAPPAKAAMLRPVSPRRAVRRARKGGLARIGHWRGFAPGIAADPFVNPIRPPRRGRPASSAASWVLRAPGASAVSSNRSIPPRMKSSRHNRIAAAQGRGAACAPRRSKASRDALSPHLKARGPGGRRRCGGAGPAGRCGRASRPRGRDGA